MASFSPVLEETIHRALTLASDRKHELATLEHLLLALLDDKDAAAVITIQRAVIHVQSSGREEVTGANALVALFAERESHAVYFLQERDMTRYDAVNSAALSMMMCQMCWPMRRYFRSTWARFSQVRAIAATLKSA